MGSARRTSLIHGLAALTIAALLLGWGSLLSPPLKPLRESLGLGELEGSRLVGERFEIINPSLEGGFEYLGRIAHYYHALFVVLLYGTLALLSAAYPRAVKNWDAVLKLAGIGTIMTVMGAIIYAYVSHEPQWHGLFIGGLAVMFAAGVLAVIEARPSKPLEWAALTCGVLLLIGGVIGGYVGAHYMSDDDSYEFRKAVIDSRFDPDLAEENELWRAWTGHQHAMIATSLALAFVALAGFMEFRGGRLSRILQWLIAPSTAIMSLASYSVWLVGGKAHLIITPAALTLITSTAALSLIAKGGSPLTMQGAVAWAARLGNAFIWLFVAAPGAMTAMSLRKPTAFFDPAFRDPAWDWVELAFNIGHWHYLLLAWGVAMLVAASALVGGRVGLASIWLSVLGTFAAGLGYVLYFATAEPKPYSLNPYSNIWIKVMVEPGLIAVGLAVVLVYYGVARRVLKKGV